MYSISSIFLHYIFSMLAILTVLSLLSVLVWLIRKSWQRNRKQALERERKARELKLREQQGYQSFTINFGELTLST